MLNWNDEDLDPKIGGLLRELANAQVRNHEVPSWPAVSDGDMSEHF